MGNKIKLVLVVGVAGAGKTTVGKVLTESLGYVFLDKDTLTQTFTGNILENYSPTKDKNGRESEFYLENVRGIEYKITLDVATENLLLGQNVIVAAPFIKEMQEKNWVEEMLESRGLTGKVDVRVVHVKSDRETEKKRIEERNEGRDAVKLANWGIYSADVEGLSVKWGGAVKMREVDNVEKPEAPFGIQMMKTVLWVSGD